jgi:hypothetical protein
MLREVRSRVLHGKIPHVPVPAQYLNERCSVSHMRLSNISEGHVYSGCACMESFSEINHEWIIM